MKALWSKIYLIFYKQTNMMKSSRKITININYNLKSNDQINSLNKSNKTNVYDKIKEILQKETILFVRISPYWPKSFHFNIIGWDTWIKKRGNYLSSIDWKGVSQTFTVFHNSTRHRIFYDDNSSDKSSNCSIVNRGK